MPRPRHTSTRARLNRPRSAWALPLCAAILALTVLVRVMHDGGSEDPRAALTEASRARTNHTAPAGIDYAPGRVAVPPRWRVVDRQGAVTTWSDPSKDDAVTVAAIESGDAPLAAVVADVAATSRRLEAARHVAAPHELRIERGARGDSALLLRMTLRDPRGRELHVRQIWRRDVRASQDVVATWTSRDDQWPTTPEQGIPEVDVR